MAHMIESVRLEDQLDNVIVVTHLSGLETRYLLQDGILHPGRLWRSSTGAHRVTFFIPFPDGPPIVLKVEEIT